MAKENVKANVVDAPTLFVGVGGTGCKIVKGVAELCREGELENINFVGLDTNVNDLSSISQSKKKIYHVQTSNTQTVGGYLDYDEDALNNWFPKNAVLYDKTVSEGAGQVRAISRLALNSAIKTGKIKPLYDAIDDLFRKSGKEMKQAMRCVMVSTASGGTGSGIILPLSMFIRDYVKNKYPNTSLIVRSLIMLPETLDSVIDSSAEKESQRRNAYATIKEINAFMMKGSGFFDINDELKRYNNLHVDITDPGTNELKELDLLPFDFCFLLDGQNAEDNTLVSLPQYIKQASQALYEQNIGPMQKKAFSVEDNIIKEMSSPGNFGRNRFGGIGAGVLKYPYDDVADYIAYDWAKDSIGGDGEAAKWTAYDYAYEIKHKEEIKKGIPFNEMQSKGSVYRSKLKTDKNPFSKDVYNMYLNDAEKRNKKFFEALNTAMHDCLSTNTNIKNTRDAAIGLKAERDYDNDESIRGHATENKELLRSYEEAVKKNAQRVAEGFAEALFINEKKTINEKDPFALEFLMKNGLGEVIHPCAMRYMLYLAQDEMVKRQKTAAAEIENVSRRLENYQPDADDSGTFDVKFTRKKSEKNLDELCEAEKSGEGDPSIIEKLGGYKKIYEKLNECFPDYYDAIEKYSFLIAEVEAYKIGYTYIKQLSDEFEKFFNGFKKKVENVTRKQDDLVDAIKFAKGDSVYNICASKAMLDELSKSTKAKMDDSGMLDSELNAKIFDAVKSNVRFEREMQYADVIEEDRAVDIFDDILLGYFKDDVRRKCTNIDMNIVEAIAMENRLKCRIKAREEIKNSDDPNQKVYDNVTREDNIHYIKEIIELGRRLAAPGIQRITNEESREVRVVAYNKILDDMRSIKVEDVISNAESVDTISKYEMHFFNAMYNVTPDKLKKFAAPKRTETGKKVGGLYHKAYFDYARFIGPDSTKNMMISTHIDKRWDSVAAMPEIDFRFQEKRILTIHKAMIYGLLFDKIKHVDITNVAKGKMIYKYENTDQRTMEMIVSNGTLCDEFYEILDALYLSSEIVENIKVWKGKKAKQDEVRNSNYADTVFAQAVKDFHIHLQKESGIEGKENDLLHEGATSLFEIPIVYYNSLPNSQKFMSEISYLVDAVIDIFEEQVRRAEGWTDAKFEMCSILVDQFEIMAKNYKKYPALSHNTSIADNPVIDITYRKLKTILETSPEPDDFENTIEFLHSLIVK